MATTISVHYCGPELRAMPTGAHVYRATTSAGMVLRVLVDDFSVRVTRAVTTDAVIFERLSPGAYTVRCGSIRTSAACERWERHARHVAEAALRLLEAAHQDGAR